MHKHHRRLDFSQLNTHPLVTKIYPSTDNHDADIKTVFEGYAIQVAPYDATHFKPYFFNGKRCILLGEFYTLPKAFAVIYEHFTLKSN